MRTYTLKDWEREGYLFSLKKGQNISKGVFDKLMSNGMGTLRNGSSCFQVKEAYSHKDGVALHRTFIQNGLTWKYVGLQPYGYSYSKAVLENPSVERNLKGCKKFDAWTKKMVKRHGKNCTIKECTGAERAEFNRINKEWKDEINGMFRA